VASSVSSNAKPAFNKVVDDLIGGGILQRVFKHEACL